jgi:release factor glutamine methyltransferase
MLRSGITRGGAARLVRARLREGGIETPDADARLLMQHATGLGQLELMTQAAATLTGSQRADLEILLTRRLEGVPVGRLIGSRDFWGLGFRLSSATLEPRPDSETIVEEALEHGRRRLTPPLRILDLGTGTGCLLIALLSELPGATGLGTDISEDALHTAAANAAANGVASRALFRQASWTDGLNERFDLIISNPPYIASGDIPGLSREVREHDPARALDGGRDGLDAYRAILAGLSGVMNPGAVAVLEIGAGQEGDLRKLGAAHGFAVIGARRDLGGHARAISLAGMPEN